MLKKKARVVYPDGEEKIYCGGDDAPDSHVETGDLSIGELSRRLRVCESSILSLMSEVHPLAEERRLNERLEEIRRNMSPTSDE